MEKITRIFKPPSDKQYLIFINELETNIEFFEQHRVCNSGSLWQPVVDKMNAEIGPKKNVEEWRLALKRWKFSVREKFRAVDLKVTEKLRNFSEVQKRLLLALGQLSVNSCRGCNTKKSDENILYPLFDDMRSCTTLSEKAKIYIKITNLQILKYDMLPHWLCSECWNNCEEWYSFLSNCKGYDSRKYKMSMDQSNKIMVQTKTVKPLKRYGNKKNSKSKRKTITASKEKDDNNEILINPIENDYHDNSNEINYDNSDPFETIFIKQESSDGSEFNDLKLPVTITIVDNNDSDLPPPCVAMEIKIEPEDNLSEHDATLDIVDSDDGVGDNNGLNVNLPDTKNNINKNLIEIPIETKVNIKMETQRKCQYKFQCDICNKSYARKQNLLNHLLAHVKSAKLNKEYLTREYECFLCRGPFKDLPTLRVHMLTHGPRDIKHKHICLQCGNAYPAAYLLKKHIKRHDPSSQSICIDCGKSFPAPENLALHNKRYMGKPDHPSLTLDFDFKSEFYKPTPVVHFCKICNKIFKTRKSLRDHGYSSHKKWEKKYLCSACGKSFIKPNILLTHQRTHDPTAELYPCTKCNKKFSTPPLMRAHIKTHMDHRPHVCSVCNKSFKTSNHLRTHTRVHTGDRPFSCDICNMTFAYLDVLKRHKNKHADMEYYRIH